MRKLKQTNQCSKCPWRVDVNPHEIPNGYDLDKHKQLQNTIATTCNLKHENQNKIHVMACHESPVEDQRFCIGWLHNQLGIGNNIALRLHMLNYDNIGKITIVGEQHLTFKDTLPD